MRLLIIRRLMSTSIAPPTRVAGMTVLDRLAFSQDVTVPCVRVAQIVGNEHHKLIRRLSPFLLKLRKHKPVIGTEDAPGSEQTIILDQRILENKGVSLSQLVSDFGNYCKIGEHEMTITYENWTAHDIFQAVIPPEVESVSSYSQMGHLVHLNLRPEQEDYKSLIGEVLLDKSHKCRTVVNKTDIIEGQFRNLMFELIAGEPDFICTIREHDCTFEFDFSKVFWNSRLSTEHARLVSQLHCQDVVYDVFGGVGPFAIPATKKGCRVIANDLNPDCAEYLKKNAKLNKVQLEQVCNLDGGQFIRDVAADDLLRRIRDSHGDDDQKPLMNAAHFIMNLPALAVEFLPNFVGLFAQKTTENDDQPAEAKRRKLLTDCEPLPPIYVHCYTFSKGDESYTVDDFKADGLAKVGKVLDGFVLNETKVHNVRNVAPNKHMLCVSFRLSEEILTSTKKS